MNEATATALALALLLAGCTGATDEPAVESQSLAAATPADPDAAAATVENATPVAAAAPSLYLLPDGTLALAPPGAAGETALGMPVNAPVWDDDDYPSWRGAPASGVTLLGTFRARVFATTTSAAVAGSNAPVFADSPGIIFQLEAAGESWGIDASGPATMKAGEIVEFTGTVTFDEPVVVPAGQEIAVTTIAIYSHVAVAAEFRIVMGPDHPTGLVPEPV